MLNLASFTFQFDAAEDRIRLIGNLGNGQPRIDFWLTRRLTLRLVDAYSKIVQQTSRRVSQSPPEYRDAMAQFEHDQARERMQATQEKVPDGEFAAQLLRRIDISFRDGRYQLRFFAGDDGENPQAVSVLTYPELHQVFHLIHTGCETLEWALPGDLFLKQSPGGHVLQ